MENTLTHYREWLIDDQYEFGEFGKHESVNPTDLPRTLEKSLMKPNVFSSIFAYYALAATGEMPLAVEDSFISWLRTIRSDNGYWASASGKQIPFGNPQGWSKNNNLRHTAKCLDFYLLIEEFSFQEGALFNDIISVQLENGAFPQFVGMEPDIWSTAYFINLLIRASMDCNLKLTVPREKELNSWQNDLANRLDRAIGWLLAQLGSDSMWHLHDSNAGLVTLAMMAEIGGYLALHRKNQCGGIVHSLINTQEPCASLVYTACLTIDTLTSEDQKIVLDEYKAILKADSLNVSDLIEATSLCKLCFFDRNIGLILYYRDNSNGHESQMAVNNPWNSSDYFKWSLSVIYTGSYTRSPIPLQEADFWEHVNQYTYKVKENIENSRGWELLWEGNIPRNEKTAQVFMDNQLQIMCKADKTSVIRENETGRGPVDFTFVNGFCNKCILEVKLASSQALRNGDFLVQIYEYAKGIGVSSAFLVIFGFYPNDENIMATVQNHIDTFRNKYIDFYLQVLYIDASKKQSASHMSFKI